MYKKKKNNNNFILNDSDLNKTFEKKKNKININSYQLSADKDKIYEMKNNKINNSIKLTYLLKNEQKKSRPQTLNKKEYILCKNNQLNASNSKSKNKTQLNYERCLTDLNNYERDKITNQIKLIDHSREDNNNNKTNSKDKTYYYSINNTNTNSNTNTNINNTGNNINILENESNYIKTNEGELNITNNSDNLKNVNINAISAENIKNIKSFNDTNQDNYNNNMSNQSLCEYYSLKEKLLEIQKRRQNLLIDSHRFHLFNNERWILSKLRQLQNKNIDKELKENGLDFYDRKFKLYSDIKRVPTKVCFRKGNSVSKSNNEDLDIYRKYNKKFINNLINRKNKGVTEKKNYNYHKIITQGFPKQKSNLNNNNNFENKLIINSNNNYKTKKNNYIMNQEIYPLLNQKKILKNILPKEVDYNTQFTIMDIINEELHPLNRFQKKNLTQHSNLISQEIELLFGQNVTLCKIPCLSNIYQNTDNRIEYKTGEKFNKLLKTLIKTDEGENIVSADVIEERKRKIIRRKYIIEKFKETIKQCMYKFKRLKITIEFFWEAIYCDKKISYQDGLYIFNTIKDGNIKSIKTLIKNNYRLAMFKDEFKQTPLHICAKRNIYQVVQLLISRLSDVNAQDVYGRTPLMCAAQGNHIESICILLFSFADPSIEDKSGKKAVDYTKDSQIEYALKFARIVHLFNRMMNNSKNFDSFVTRGISHLFSKELGINYEPWLKINDEVQNKDDDL